MPVVLDERKYAKLLTKHLPAVIETNEEHERLSEILMHMTIPPRKLSPEEGRMARLIGHLVDEYERRVASKKAKRFSAVERLEFLMEEHRLRQMDLAEIFGGQSV